MTRVEIAGWLQLIVAVVALFFTVNVGGPVFEAIGQLGAGGAMPPEFAGAQGALRVFLFLLLLIVLGGLLFTGLGIVLGALFRQLKAAHPYHTAFTFVITLFLLTLTLTAAIFNHYSWIILSMATFLSLALTGVAGVSEDNGNYWGTLGAGAFVVMLFGSMITGVAYSSNPAPSDAGRASTAGEAAAIQQKNADGAAAPSGN